MIRKILLAGGVCVAGVALAAGPAAAHECFNVSRSAQANSEIAAHSNGWFDIQTSQLVAILVSGCLAAPDPTCPPTDAIPGLSANDVAYIQNPANDVVGEILGFVPRSQAVTDLMAFTSVVAADAATCNVPLDYLTKPNSTAAGGAPTKVVTNGTGIDHFPEVYHDQLVAGYTAAYSGAQVICP
jgi:hypothetical protein